MSRTAMNCLLAALCVFLVAVPSARAVEEITSEADLERFLADQADHQLIVVCTVPEGDKWNDEREMIEIAEAFFTER